MSDELKPCPFCGGECYATGSDVFWVACSNNCDDDAFDSEDSAISAWNTRILTPKQQLADEMYEELQAVSNWLNTQLGMGEWHKDIEKILTKARGEHDNN